MLRQARQAGAPGRQMLQLDRLALEHRHAHGGGQQGEHRLIQSHHLLFHHAREEQAGEHLREVTDLEHRLAVGSAVTPHRAATEAEHLIAGRLHDSDDHPGAG